jgi:uncharacterized protein (TIGR00645 family)
MNAVIVRIIVLSRWLLVPLFLGLIVALVFLVAFFMYDLWQLCMRLVSMTATEIDVIITLLSLIDLTLLGNLIVIIVYSGYENFVEKIDHGDEKGWPLWMTRVSFSGLKQKLFASMMAISGVTLLKALMKLEISVSELQVRWLVVANIVFLVAFAVLTLTDRAARDGKKEDAH